MKVCALQGGSCSLSIEQNNELITKQLEKALECHQPGLIVCSELMNVPYFAAVQPVNNLFFQYAETKNGPTVTRFAKFAKEHQVHLIGTYFEVEEINQQKYYYNTAFVCSPTRGVIGQYRKVHLPKVTDATMVTDEKYYFEQFGDGGNEFPIFTLDDGLRVGILICFDRSFPEAWRSLSLQGVDLICVPTATYGYRKSLYTAELQVRALENNLYVVGVNKASKEKLDGEKIARVNFGLSCIVDPFGELLEQAGEQPWETICATIDLEQIKRSKSRVDFLAERKPTKYHSLQGSSI